MVMNVNDNDNDLSFEDLDVEGLKLMFKSEGLVKALPHIAEVISVYGNKINAGQSREQALKSLLEDTNYGYYVVDTIVGIVGVLFSLTTVKES